VLLRIQVDAISPIDGSLPFSKIMGRLFRHPFSQDRIILMDLVATTSKNRSRFVKITLE
jgi:hypothetical protein